MYRIIVRKLTNHLTHLFQVTDEGELRAHRVILSACSPHLRDVLKRHAASQNANLLIYLRGIRQSDLLVSFLQFYNRILSVSQLRFHVRVLRRTKTLEVLDSEN
jgi:hypothetical protein